VKQPYRHLDDAAWLATRYRGEGLSLEDIALLVGCTPGGVGKALVRHGIPLRPRGRRSPEGYVPKRNKPRYPCAQCWRLRRNREGLCRECFNAQRRGQTPATSETVAAPRGRIVELWGRGCPCARSRRRSA
jgi:hypothetical protein